MGRITWRLGVAGSLALVAASAFAGQITLYERSGLQGQNLTTTIALPDLERSAFSDLASSVVVSDGTWEACTEPYFRGRCAQLAPGTYRRLVAELQGPVASVRQIDSAPEPARVFVAPDSLPIAATGTAAPIVINPGAAPVVINPAPGQPAPIAVAPVVPNEAPAAARIVLYQHMGRVVRAVELTTNVDDLDARHFDNSADAALVSGATWRLCDGEGGRGRCTDFSPGQYVSLGTLDGKVRSAYLVPTGPDRVAAAVTAPAGRAVLYEFPNFGGAWAAVENGPAPDLDWARFKNPASSLRIESGSWLVCSQIGYQGDCQVLDPGEYPVLTGSLSHGIASARRVWRPEYGSLAPALTRDARPEVHPDLSRYVP